MNTRSIIRHFILALIIAWGADCKSFPFHLATQDGLTDTSLLKKNFTWSVSLGSYQQYKLIPPSRYYEPLPVLLPGDPELQRRYDDPEIRSLWELENNYATDNPLFHFPYFIDFYGKQQLAPWFSFEFRAIVEHRGLSYGIYNLKNIALLPQYRVNINKAFKLSRDSLLIDAKIGYENTFSFDERLTIYNLDIDGTYARLKFKKWNFHLLHIGDLFASIGLNINDALHVSLFRIHSWKSLNLKYGLSHALSDVVSIPQTYHNTDFSLALFQKENFRVYTQWSYRYSSFAFHKKADPDENLAGILGFKLKYDRKKTSISTRMEARYYGRFYNTFLKTTNVYYREEANPYANSIGPHLYPLYRYDRPFGQWAVYNEYNSNALMAGSVELDYRRQLAKFVKFRINLDMHLIVPRRMQVFAFAFYECGALISMPQDYLLFAGISNKGMNLDKHYPTHYVYLEPVFQIKFSKEIFDFDRN